MFFIQSNFTSFSQSSRISLCISTPVLQPWPNGDVAHTIPLTDFISRLVNMYMCVYMSIWSSTEISFEEPARKKKKKTT